MCVCVRVCVPLLCVLACDLFPLSAGTVSASATSVQHGSLRGASEIIICTGWPCRDDEAPRGIRILHALSMCVCVYAQTHMLSACMDVNMLEQMHVKKKLLFFAFGALLHFCLGFLLVSNFPPFTVA